MKPKWIVPSMPTAIHCVEATYRTAMLRGEPPFKRWHLFSDGAVMFGDDVQVEYEEARRGLLSRHLHRGDTRVWAVKRAIDRDPKAPHEARAMACGIG